MVISAESSSLRTRTIDKSKLYTPLTELHNLPEFADISGLAIRTEHQILTPRLQKHIKRLIVKLKASKEEAQNIVASGIASLAVISFYETISEEFITILEKILADKGYEVDLRVLQEIMSYSSIILNILWYATLLRSAGIITVEGFNHLKLFINNIVQWSKQQTGYLPLDEKPITQYELWQSFLKAAELPVVVALLPFTTSGLNVLATSMMQKTINALVFIKPTKAIVHIFATLSKNLAITIYYADWIQAPARELNRDSLFGVRSGNLLNPSRKIVEHEINEPLAFVTSKRLILLQAFTVRAFLKDGLSRMRMLNHDAQSIRAYLSTYIEREDAELRPSTTEAIIDLIAAVGTRTAPPSNFQRFVESGLLASLLVVCLWGGLGYIMLSFQASQVSYGVFAALLSAVGFAMTEIIFPKGLFENLAQPNAFDSYHLFGDSTAKDRLTKLSIILFATVMFIFGLASGAGAGIAAHQALVPDNLIGIVSSAIAGGISNSVATWPFLFDLVAKCILGFLNRPKFEEASITAQLWSDQIQAAETLLDKINIILYKAAQITERDMNEVARCFSAIERALKFSFTPSVDQTEPQVFTATSTSVQRQLSLTLLYNETVRHKKRFFLVADVYAQLVDGRPVVNNSLSLSYQAI